MTIRPARADVSASPRATSDAALSSLLRDYTAEVTSRDVDAAIESAPRGLEVFVANLPKDGNDLLVSACMRLREAGLVPVPHIVARKIADQTELEDLLGRLAGEAGVDRVLSLGGDRDESAGPFGESLALIESGVFDRNGVRHVSIACYPEGHPRIADPSLEIALRYKIAAITKRGMQARLVSQFAFSPEPILEFARGLRASGVTTPLRVGVAGPAPRTTLVKYAMRCGVGASLRALTERKSLIGGLFGGGETPEDLLRAVAGQVADDPSLGIEGVHFFTFGAPTKSIEWAEGRIE